jgi:type IV pilus assembly protein PilB
MTAHTGHLLGHILVDAQVLSESRLAEALDRQPGSGKRLGTILIEMGLVDEHTIVAALGVQMGLNVIDLRGQKPDDDAVALVPEGLARTLVAAPVRRTPVGLEVAVAEPLDGSGLAQLEGVVGAPVVMRLAPAEDVRQTIERSYSRGSRTGRSSAADLDTFDQRAVDRRREDGHEALHALVSDAFHAGASDIHIEIRAGGTRVRYRIDGVLAPVTTVTEACAPAVVRDAADRAGRGQTGRIKSGRCPHRRFRMTVDGHDLLVLVTQVMTIQGERVRMRLTSDDTEPLRRLDQLGMPTLVRQSFTAALREPSGLVVIAGPRGSGRTTTAYAAVAEIDTRQRSVVMIEREATCVLSSVSQIEVKSSSAVASLLAALEDQDADVVVVDGSDGVGAIRAAIQLAQAQVLVLMTMTAGDADATRARLHDADVGPCLVPRVLRAALSLRSSGRDRPELGAIQGDRAGLFELYLR